MNHHVPVRCTLMLFATLALHGCSSGDAPSSFQASYDAQIGWSGSTSKACGLFTTTEVSAITGSEVVDSRTFAVDSGQCQWLSRSDFGAKLSILDARAWYAGNNLPNREVLDLAGTDEAYLVDDEGIHIARARTGDTMVVISTSKREATLLLLRQTLERLPAWLSS